jgi:1-acyl-sn-glycerol-3-phosphate acyltransferase
MSTQSTLLRSRRFLPLFVTQFLGAFNDNVIKNAIVVLLAFQSAQWTTMAPELLANVAAGIFILPFFLFSATAGQLADKYDKARIARLVKLLEIVIVLVAGVALSMHSMPLILSALFLLGVHSTLFGPVKFAILPQHLKADELVGGNALVEAGTFVAILVGTLLGGLLAGQGETTWITVAGLVIAVLGYIASRGIPSAPAPEPELVINPNPITETWRNIGFARTNPVVFRSIMGISWFWLFGALFLTQIPLYVKNVIGGSETAVTLILATFTLGIGVGSMLCEKLSGHRVEIGLVPLGSIGLTVFAIDLAFASPAAPLGVGLTALALLAEPGIWRVLVDLAGLGIFGGLFIVPLYALVQSRADPRYGARIIAANNIVNSFFMVVGSLVAAALLSNGLSIPMLFAVAGVLNALVAIHIYRLVPEFMLRFLVWILIRTVYRLRCIDLDKIPETGAAVLVCNHVSFVDALVLGGACRRPARFVMDHNIFRWPLLSYLFRAGKAIPIASAKEDPVMMERAFAEIGRALDDGEIVCIFPEGAITRDGEMSAFRPGITRILERNPVLVVPMALRGLWGSFFSRIEGRAMSKPWRRGLFTPIELVVGEPIAPAQASPAHLQSLVGELRGNWK